MHRLIPGTPDPWRVILSTMVPAGLEFWQDTAIVAVTGLFGLTALGLMVTDTLQSPGELKPSLNITTNTYIIGGGFIYFYVT